jgi:hypothetical protein
MTAGALTEAHDSGLRYVDALLKAAGIAAPAGQLPGLAADYEQIRMMAALLRSAEDDRPWQRTL